MIARAARLLASWLIDRVAGFWSPVAPTAAEAMSTIADDIRGGQ